MFQQPPLPGLNFRGRPRSGLSRAESIKRCQAERRKAGTRKSLSVEIDGKLLDSFKTTASCKNLKLREAVEDALKIWLTGTSIKKAARS